MCSTSKLYDPLVWYLSGAAMDGNGVFSRHILGYNTCDGSAYGYTRSYFNMAWRPGNGYEYGYGNHNGNGGGNGVGYLDGDYAYLF